MYRPNEPAEPLRTIDYDNFFEEKTTMANINDEGWCRPFGKIEYHFFENQKHQSVCGLSIAADTGGKRETDGFFNDKPKLKERQCDICFINQKELYAARKKHADRPTHMHIKNLSEGQAIKNLAQAANAVNDILPIGTEFVLLAWDDCDDVGAAAVEVISNTRTQDVVRKMSHCLHKILSEVRVD